MITAEAVEKSATKIVPAGSIMVGIRVGVGKVAINSVPMCTSQDIISIIGIDEGRWNKEYISLALQYKAPILASQAQGATITGITSKTLKSIAIPVLPLAAQNAIVSQLRSIEQQIACMTVMLSQLDSLVKSRFIEMFGDPVTAEAKRELRAIGNFADVQTGATPLRRESKYYGGSIPWVKTGEVARKFANGVEESITEVAIKETNCKVFPAGTVLVAMYGQGDTRGKAAILPFEAATNQACAAIMPSLAHNEVFLNVQLQLLYEDMRAKSLGGNQKNLSLGIVKSMKVILPPMEAQHEFASFAAQVDKSRFVAQQQIEKLQMLYDSLAQEYFGD